MYKIAIFVLIFCCLCHLAMGQSQTLMSDQIQMEEKLQALLAEMTLSEKLGQLTLYTAHWGEKGQAFRESHLVYLREGKVGAVLNAIQPDFVKEMQRIAVEETRLKIPLLFGFDVIHGFRTIFPIPLAEAASWNPDLMEQTARVAATEASAVGIHWTFAPMVDIARDPRWGRIAEGSGEDTYLACRIAIARVHGFQGQNLRADDTIVACVKHYAAYGAAEAGRDYNIVDMSDQRLREIYLPPFQAAVQAGAKSIMTSFNEINGIPSTANRKLLTDILRDEWDFDGFVVTDYTSINELVPHGIAANLNDAGKLSILAGVDMDMEGGVFQNELPSLVEKGVVPEALIDQAVMRILRVKWQLGLFEDPYRYCNLQRAQERMMTKENLNTALCMAQEAIVLLKNQAETLPLSKKIKTIAVIGPLAENRVDQMGCWWGAGDANHVVTPIEGIKAVVSPETQILYAQGCGIQDSTTQEFAKAIELAKQADVVIAVLGESAAMSGEAASRASISLPGVQEELLQQLHQTGKPVVLVLINGRPLTISWAAENIPAILECWQLGTQSGHAIASVLFGEYNPSGKLPITFPRCEGQIPIYYNYKSTGRPVSKEKYTSKYLDVPHTPLYPFGYGQSYTTFGYSELTLDKNNMTIEEKLGVSVKVTNTGKLAGVETVQLYIRDEVASLTRPVKELRGFQKIHLNPGESKQVTFTLKPQDLAFYDRNRKWTVEPGTFVIMVGGNSVETLSATVEVTPNK